jgi:nucleotide-binding universal stress UspA family protein
MAGGDRDELPRLPGVRLTQDRRVLHEQVRVSAAPADAGSDGELSATAQGERSAAHGSGLEVVRPDEVGGAAVTAHGRHESTPALRRQASPRLKRVAAALGAGDPPTVRDRAERGGPGFTKPPSTLGRLRGPMSAPGFRHITVAVDGSPNSSVALDDAIDLAQHYSATLTVVAVAPLVPVYVAPAEPFSPGIIPPSELPRYKAIVDASVQRARAAGIATVSGYAQEGVVVDELLDLLEKHPTDLLVMGSRGLSTTKRIFLGSVSSALVAHAPCPVLVIRPAATKHRG